MRQTKDNDEDEGLINDSVDSESDKYNSSSVFTTSSLLRHAIRRYCLILDNCIIYFVYIVLARREKVCPLLLRHAQQGRQKVLWYVLINYKLYFFN